MLVGYLARSQLAVGPLQHLARHDWGEAGAVAAGSCYPADSVAKAAVANHR